jgi:phosphate-selective porin OprO/OprP
MKLKSLVAAAVLSTSWAPHPVLAQNSNQDETIKRLLQRIDELDQKVRILERNRELDGEAADLKAQTTPTLTIDEKGLGVVNSSDGSFSLRVRGMVQVDSRSYLNDGGINSNDSFLLRRARPSIEGTFHRDFDFQLMTEFGGTGTPSLLDANVNYRYRPELQLKVGKFKQPVGLEVIQADPVRLFAENALPNNLLPNRDLGVQLHGDIKGGMVQYQAGIFNGLGDGRSSSNGDFDDDKDLVGRVFVHPFQLKGPEWLRGLGVGIAGSFGRRDSATGLPASYVTDGQQAFFTYTGTAVADGDAIRWSPQLCYFNGPFGLQAEYVSSRQDVRIPTRVDSLENTAWAVTATYLLTGEDASFKGVQPRKPFNPATGDWGAFQVLARAAQLDVDDRAFALGYAAPGTSASRATSWAVGLNWYLNRNVRTSLSFSHTEFEGGAAGAVTRQDENFLVSRLQLAF